MALADDINTLRQAGASDESIISAYQAMRPDQAGDITTLLKGGAKPASVIEALQAFDGAQREQNVQNESVLGELRHGTAGAATGMANTLKAIAPDNEWAKRASDALDSGAQVINDPSYVPASQSMGKDSTWGQWFRSLPYAMVGGVPGVAQDLGAGAAGTALGGPLGGLVGFGGSTLARTFGDNAVNNAAGRGVRVDLGNGGPQPSTEDKARALAQSAAQAILSKVGISSAGGSVLAAGESALPALAGQVAKGALVDAGTSAASDLIHQALTPNANLGNLDTNSLLNAAALGATQGGIIRAGLTARDANLAQQHAPIQNASPEAAQALGDRLAQYDNIGTPSGDYQAITGVQDRLQNELSTFSKGVKPQLNELQRQNGFKDDTGLILQNAMSDINAGRPVDPVSLDTLRTRLGNTFEGANLTDALAQHSALNQFVSNGNLDDKSGTFTTGISATPFVQNWINPTGSGSKMDDYTAGILGLGGHTMYGLANGAVPLAITMGTQGGLYGAAQAVDALLGNNQPVQNFVDRFASSDNPAQPDIMQSNANLPSFQQLLATQRLASQATRGNSSGGGSSQAQSSAQSAQQMASTAALVSALRARPTQAQTEPSPKITLGSTGPRTSPGPGVTMASRASEKSAEPPMRALGADVVQPAPKPSRASPGVTRDGTPKNTHEQVTQEGTGYRFNQSGDRILVNKHGQTVNRDARPVHNPEAYADAIGRNLTTRHQAIEGAKKLLPAPQDKEGMNVLHTLMTHSNNWPDAYGHIEHAVNGLHVDDSVKGKLFDKLASPNVQATWKNQERPGT